jgi:septum formation protein
MKAQSVVTRLRATGRGHDPLLVLGCDSVLHFGGHILGKPDDAADATARWRRMRGNQGVLYTGHCVIDLASDAHTEAFAATTVHFADVTDEEIDAYVASGEPQQVAGAFTIDGLGGAFVERLDGDHSNVVGLSKPLLRKLMAELGLEYTAYWRQG